MIAGKLLLYLLLILAVVPRLCGQTEIEKINGEIKVHTQATKK